MTIVDVPSTLPTEPEPEARRITGGYCGAGAWHGVFETTAAGAEHALYVDGDRVILGKGDWETVVTLGFPESGDVGVTLKTRHGSFVVVDGVVRVSETATTGFVIEQLGGEDQVRVRTSSGLYCSASDPGQPIALTAQADAATTFTLRRTDQYGAKWAADFGFPFSEAHSTHLWVFRRANEFIQVRKPLGSGPMFRGTYREEDRLALRWCLSDDVFRKAVEVGIYEADNFNDTIWAKLGLDPYTSGVLYSAHFWNPRTGNGGEWDPDSKGPNNTHNAFHHGTGYFQLSLMDDDPSASGYRLGLATHYLQDLTQPMHCGLFRNFPESDDWRHENFEFWVLHQQDRWQLTDQDFDDHSLDMRVLRADHDREWTNYWSIVASEALAVFDSWKSNPRSPIGEVSKVKQLPSHFAEQEWRADASKMLKLAQRAVINMLLSWASLSKFGRSHRGLPPPGSEALALAHMSDKGASTHKVIGANRFGNERADVAYYHRCSAVGAREAWTLEPVGALDHDGHPLNYIKNSATGKYLVAGDSADGNVYMQDPGGRLNAKWAVIPGRTVVRAEDNQSYPLCRFRDGKHGRFLAGSWHESTTGSLRHLAAGDSSADFDWMRMPADRY